MKTVSKQTRKSAVTVGKQRSYNEIIELLDKSWKPLSQKTLANVKKLDQALGTVSQKLNTILVTGTNGKSLTINFTAQLLKQEGLSVGTFYAPHLLTYNERFSISNETISNKTFTEIANEVLHAAETTDLDINALEILTMMSLVWFKKTNVDVAILEVGNNAQWHPATICKAKIAAVTRVTVEDETNTQEMHELIEQMMSVAGSGMHVISADQSKLNLQAMQELVEKKKGMWAMPIRKLASLSYPFEQLHGRCAALAERIAALYVNECWDKKNTIEGSGSLLVKQKGQRGRPTLEAKRQAELNPKKTIEQYWKETTSLLPARFQLLDKEKPTLLLDNASNLDAFKNLLLGIRLLHYQRPLKGLTLVIGCNNPNLNIPEFLKALRYFFKKTSGQVIVCPVEAVAGQDGSTSWNVEQITNDIKSMKIKAKAAKSFKEAFNAAQKTVDERNGLVVITGSSAIISEYWQQKGIKKL